MFNTTSKIYKRNGSLLVLKLRGKFRYAVNSDRQRIEVTDSVSYIITYRIYRYMYEYNKDYNQLSEHLKSYFILQIIFCKTSKDSYLY